MEAADYENMVKISADSVGKLRRCDVFRVLEWSMDRVGLAGYIIANRPDLKEEVEEVLSELV